MEFWEENIKKMLQQELRERPRGECPEEETLAAYLEGGLSEERASQLTGHLSRCSQCLESVKALRQILAEPERESRTRVPAEVLETARRMDPAKKGIMEVVVGFARNAARVISMGESVSGGLVPATDQVRKEEQVLSETLVSFRKDFPPFTAEVDVESVKPGRGEIYLRVFDPQKTSPQGLRATLYEEGESEEKELESIMLRDGEAVFENVKYGRYKLAMTRAGEPVGTIALEMKGEGK